MWFLFSFGLLIWFLALLWPPGYVSVFLATLASCAIALSSFVIILRKHREFIGYKAMAAYFGLQPFFFLALLIVYPQLMIERTGSVGMFDVRPVGIFYTFSFIPLMALFYAFLLSSVTQNRERNLPFYLHLATGRMNLFLVVTALISFSIWFSTINSDPISYLFRVLHKGLFLAPFFAGLYFKQSRAIVILWMVTFVFGVILAVFTGTRAYVFYPIVSYGLGILFQAKKGRERSLWIILALVLIPIVLFSLGLIQNIRNEFGRGNISEVNVVEIFSNLDSVLSKTIESEDQHRKQTRELPFWSGLTRLVNWPQLYVPIMSPDPVEYRGYDDIHMELLSQLMVFDVSGTEGRYYNSKLFARMYGFNVYYEKDYSGKLHSHSVPFGIIADSWSRFGPISLFIQVSIAFLFFTLVEVINRSLFRRSPEMIIIGLIIILRMSFYNISSVTLLNTMRDMMLQYIFIMSTFYCILSIWRKMSSYNATK